jgi:hypothetical protein
MYKDRMFAGLPIKVSREQNRVCERCEIYAKVEFLRVLSIKVSRGLEIHRGLKKKLSYLNL